MAVTLNASTTSGFVQSADTSGIIQLQSNGTTIATISSTGLQQNVGAPAFSAYSTTNQSISSATNTKVQFNLESFDTANCYDTTNYRFTPNVAGYYQFSSGIYTGGNNGFFGVSLAKNGSFINELQRTTSTTTVTGGSVLAYANGTTDYFEIYVYTSGSGLTIGAGGSPYMWFTGAMVRSA